MTEDSKIDYARAKRELSDAVRRLKGETHRDDTPSKPFASGPPYCSFCGKGKGEVDAMISGPSVFICNECVQACNTILENRNSGDPSDDA